MYETPTVSQTFGYAYQNIVVKLVQYIPLLLSALIILIIGWIIVGLIARALNRVMRLLGVDKIFEQAKIDDFLKTAGSKRDTVGLIIHIVKWILLLVVFMATVQALQLPAVSDFFSKVIAYTPNVLAAILILLIGVIVANASDKIIEGALKAGKIGFGPTLGVIAKYAVITFSIIAALSQLGIAKALLEILFSGLVAMAAIAGGLAFGLGGKDTAKELLDKVKSETK